MSKILFILGMYKPRMSPNGICCEKVINKFIEEGNEVWCVVNKEINSKDIECIEGAHIHRIKPRLTYRINEYCEYNPTLKRTKILLKISKFLSKVKLALTIPFWPMVSPLYTYRFYKEARKLHREQKFDVVIGVYTPIDSLYAAHLLKKMDKNIKFVAYFLDSLSGGFGLNFMSERYIIKNGKKWEERLLSNADKIIAMNSSKEHHLMYNSNTDYFNKITFLDIPLLVMPKNNNKKYDFIKENSINIVFTGMVKYPIRNPNYIIDLFSSIQTEIDLDLKLYFIGENNCKNIFDAAKEKLKEKIYICNKVEHADAVAIMSQANFLLNLGTENQSQTPSKVIEYIASGKPIINTYRIDIDPGNEYLKDYPYAFLLDEREEITEELKDKFIKFIEENHNKKVEFEEIKDKFYKSTPDTFVREIQNI